MRNSILVCAFVALSVFAAEARFVHNRDVLGSSASSKTTAEGTGDGSKAHVTAHASSKEGTSVAVGKAYSKVDEKAVNAVAYAISTAYTAVRDGAPVKNTVDAKAVAVAKAYALAYADAYAFVYSDNEANSACVRAFASGKAAATAFAKAYAAGVALAKNKYGEIVADGSAEAFAAATANAYAKAEANVCVNGKGHAEASQESLAVSLVRPIATAMYKAFVAVDSYGTTTGYAAAESESTKVDEVTFAESTGHAGVETYGDGDGFAQSEGFGAAASEQVSWCSGYISRKCCRRRYYPYGHGSDSATCGCGKDCEAKIEESKLDYHVMKTVTVTEAYGGPYGVGYQCYCF